MNETDFTELPVTSSDPSTSFELVTTDEIDAAIAIDEFDEIDAENLEIIVSYVSEIRDYTEATRYTNEGILYALSVFGCVILIKHVYKLIKLILPLDFV